MKARVVAQRVQPTNSKLIRGSRRLTPRKQTEHESAKEQDRTRKLKRTSRYHNGISRMNYASPLAIRSIGYRPAIVRETNTPVRTSNGYGPSYRVGLYLAILI